jgi:hypothetical protein
MQDSSLVEKVFFSWVYCQCALDSDTMSAAEKEVAIAKVVPDLPGLREVFE